MRYGSFAASMTGNVIFAGRQLASLAWQDFLFYFAIMVAWSSGSFVYHQIEKVFPRRGASRAALLVAIFSTAIDIAFNLSARPGDPRNRWWIVGLVPIFGVEEAFALTHLKLPATGVSKCWSKGGEEGQQCKDVYLSAVMLIGLITGAVLGERLAATFGLEVRWCFLPVSPLVMLAIWVHEPWNALAWVIARRTFEAWWFDGSDQELTRFQWPIPMFQPSYSTLTAFGTLQRSDQPTLPRREFIAIAEFHDGLLPLTFVGWSSSSRASQVPVVVRHVDGALVDATEESEEEVQVWKDAYQLELEYRWFQTWDTIQQMTKLVNHHFGELAWSLGEREWSGKKSCLGQSSGFAFHGVGDPHASVSRAVLFTLSRQLFGHKARQDGRLFGDKTAYVKTFRTLGGTLEALATMTEIFAFQAFVIRFHFGIAQR
ncbi:RRM domain-containing protein [Durusdinium trenchii]|uniref:RRM domain-containing protein n=1 Tax=Durusdinium trenchii TaxID=1381693 RepID=A0ABP0M0D5_9DINO